MANSPVHQLRIDPTLKGQIDRARGRESLSAWLREAATQRLQSERGLGPEITQTLANLTAQLRGLGTNAAGHGEQKRRPVVRGRRRRVRVTAVAKGPQVPVAGGGHMQSAIRHVV